LEKDSPAAGAARGGIKQLDYLNEHWMTVPLWQSWSEFGRIRASTVLKIPVDGVIPTTNHLESFNAILKKKHLAALLHSGHRLRFDSLIHLLITRVLPDIFKNRKTQIDYNNWLAFRFYEQAGGKDLVEAHKSEVNERNARRKAPLCWWIDNHNRDIAAKEIISTGTIKFSRRPDGDGYMATCTATSSREPATKHRFLEYDLHCNRNGDAACSCPDFQTHGGACKHLRALRLAIEHWISQRLELPFYFPILREQAENLRWIESCVNNLSNVAGENIPVPHVVQSLPWDPTIIQNLGGDRTILGDDGDEIADRVSDLINSDSNMEDSDTEFGIRTVCF
jgi:hypothetical protein